MKRNKAEFDIYKTYGMYSDEEIQGIIEDMECLDDEEFSETEAHERVAMLANDDYWYDFKVEVEDFDQQHDYTYRVDIHFGTWLGPQTGYADRNSLMEAIYAACNNLEEFRIFEDGYGKLIVEGYHHDSSDNHMEIYLLKNGKRRNIHFRKQVYGVGY